MHKVPSVRCLRCASIHTAILSSIEGNLTVEIKGSEAGWFVETLRGKG